MKRVLILRDISTGWLLFTGRARADNARFTALGAEGDRTVQREFINKSKEVLMNDLLADLRSMPKEAYLKERSRIQSDLIANWQRREREEEMKCNALVEERNQYKLECLICGEFACTLNDIRTLNLTHHVVMDKTFNDRIFTAPHPNKKKIGIGMEKINKLFCKKCEKKSDWGIQILYNGAVFSVIKVVSFIVRDPEGNTKRYKQWSKMPVKSSEATTDEIQKYHKEV